MSRLLLGLAPVLALASFTVLVGCPPSGGDAGSSSASPASSVKVARTCKDAAGRYGEHLAASLLADSRSPFPADKRDKAKAAIKDAVIRSCEEDKWSDLPLDCLALMFERPEPLPGTTTDQALTVCANGAGKESSSKMDDRVGRAMAEVMKGGAEASAAPAVAAAPWPSKDGGFEIDFRGEKPDEAMKDDPNGGTWHDASLARGWMAQYTDYANDLAAIAEVKVFVPTREKDKIKRDEAITVQGLKGRDIEMTLASGKTFWIRFLIDGKRVFKLGAVYSGDNSEAKAFIESFKRSGAPAPAPSASATASAGPAPVAAPVTHPPSGASKPPAPPKPARPLEQDPF